MPFLSNNRFIMRKHVFRVSEKVRLKSVWSATETRQNIEILPVASGVLILFRKRIDKGLIRLCKCTG